MPWPSLRTVLLGVNLVVLLLPIGGVVSLRLYESELIRQTESELLAQGVLVAAVVRDAHRRSRGDGTLAQSLPATSPVGFVEDATPLPSGKGPLDPRLPRLDISQDVIRPPAPPAAPAPAVDPLLASLGPSLDPILMAASRGTLAAIRVVDPAGVVIASSGGDKGLSLAHWEEVGGALEGEDVRLLRERSSDESFSLASISRGNRVRVFIALPMIDGEDILGAVLLSRTPLTPAKALYQNRGTLLLGGAALLGLAVMVSILTSLTIGRPVRRLIEQSRRIGEGKGAQTLDSPGTREVAELSLALTQMAEALKERADYIQAFASGVSHEFKTPLASMKGSVELLQDHFGEMDEAERRNFLDMLRKDIDRLGRLVGRLLELARAEVAAPGKGPSNLGEVVRSLGERFRGEGMDLHIQHPEALGPVAMDGAILESIVFNLLDNARRHGGLGVRVDVSAGEGDGGLWLRVRDYGAGVSPANRGRIFDSFFTTARGEGGTGLGLSVIRAHLLAHGGDITLETPGEGACFHVRLPRA